MGRTCQGIVAANAQEIRRDSRNRCSQAFCDCDAMFIGTTMFPDRVESCVGSHAVRHQIFIATDEPVCNHCNAAGFCGRCRAPPGRSRHRRL
jgi:hypothetical protein